MGKPDDGCMDPMEGWQDLKKYAQELFSGFSVECVSDFLEILDELGNDVIAFGLGFLTDSCKQLVVEGLRVFVLLDTVSNELCEKEAMPSVLGFKF